MFTKSQLKDIFSRYGFTPLKRLGENYLIDANIKDKIIAEAGVDKGDIVLEIGCGFGALTIDLASTGALIFAVEKDRKAYSILKEIYQNKYDDLQIFNEDMLNFEISKLHPKKKIKVVGNLPYYVTTPIIEYLINNRIFIDSALIVVQKEVASRIMASAGSKEYGSMSCFIRYFTKPSYVYTIKRQAFYPEPEVDSSLVRLDFLAKPSVRVSDESLLFKVIRGAFNQRRKTIMNSLSRAEVLDLPKAELTGILDKAGIKASSRPEDLSLEAFANLTNAI
jgi:16S rRNA (adenine1518-N6/adenine1519-N6)-dimethyltransferase